MNPFKILWTAVSFVIGFAVLAFWYIPVTLWGAQISAEVAQVTAGENTKLANLTEGPAPVAWLRQRSKLNKVYTKTDLTTQRDVSFDTTVPFSTFLKPGEVAPDPAFQDLYATARASAYFTSYCAEMLEYIAVKCKLSGSTVRTNRDGLIRVSGSISYIPVYDMGEPSEVENGKLLSASARLAEYDEFKNTSESRAVLYNRALNICAAAKDVFGNCVLTSIRFGTKLRGDVETLDASVLVSIYADKTQYRRDSLKAEIDNIVEQVRLQ